MLFKFSYMSVTISCMLEPVNKVIHYPQTAMFDLGQWVYFGKFCYIYINIANNGEPKDSQI